MDLLCFCSVLCLLCFVRVCLYVLCGHLLGKGWPLGSRLWCLLWVCHFPIGILGQVWYLIVSIPDLCTFTYFCSRTQHSDTGEVWTCGPSVVTVMKKVKVSTIWYLLEVLLTWFFQFGHLSRVGQIDILTVYILKPRHTGSHIDTGKLNFFILWMHTFLKEIKTETGGHVHLLKKCLVDPATVCDPKWIQSTVCKKIQPNFL